MGADDLPGDVEAKTKTAKAIDRACAFKAVENSGLVSLGNPRSAVSDGNPRSRHAVGNAYLDRFSSSVFYRVSQKVRDHLLESQPIPLTLGGVSQKLDLHWRLRHFPLRAIALHYFLYQVK